uniref:Uncharacterized protein n=1 Tax=Octopus bimaculoides TaxID=37653 RepID=A0A0L8FP61_OCTBM
MRKSVTGHWSQPVSLTQSQLVYPRKRTALTEPPPNNTCFHPFYFLYLSFFRVFDTPSICLSFPFLLTPHYLSFFLFFITPVI